MNLDIKTSLAKCFETILTNVDETEANDHLKLIIHFIVESLQWFKKTGIAEVESELEDSSSFTEVNSVSERMAENSSQESLTSEDTSSITSSSSLVSAKRVPLLSKEDSEEAKDQIHDIDKRSNAASTPKASLLKRSMSK